jgi:hypothetical protein
VDDLDSLLLSSPGETGPPSTLLAFRRLFGSAPLFNDIEVAAFVAVASEIFLPGCVPMLGFAHYHEIWPGLGPAVVRLRTSLPTHLIGVMRADPAQLYSKLALAAISRKALGGAFGHHVGCNNAVTLNALVEAGFEHNLARIRCKDLS